MSNFELSDSQSYLPQESSPMPSILGEDFTVQFWGVRGLIPTPTSNTRRYGGNTACVEMYIAGQSLIFDGGTGLRVLGKNWQELHKNLEAHLFFTNAQSNRIQGFPFFAPAFMAENCFHIYGNAASNGASIKQCLCDQMLQPHFPYPLQVMQSDLQFYNLTPGKEIELKDVTVQTALINKTQRSMGYRINWNKYSVGYVTDLHQTIDAEDKERILHIIKDVDLLIANATYTPPTANNHECAEFLWEIPVELAHSANVKRLVISHHHPDDHDEFLDHIQEQVKSAFNNTILASEGMILAVNK
jgi:phosphoribosyl 1,2-cyclic phosphodiesterase